MGQIKKELELLILSYFRETYKYFPKGKLSCSESPDFILQMKNRHKLGIELTRLNPFSADHSDSKKELQAKLNEEIVELSKKLFKESNNEHLFVKILFADEEYSPAPMQKISAAAQIAQEIREAVKGKNPNTFYSITLNDKHLPAYLMNILIVNDPRMPISLWEVSNKLGVSTDIIEDIKRAIVKKDEKLRLYQIKKLNYYWLLITTDRLRGVKKSNLSDVISAYPFNSRFQHVFLFDMIKSKVFELI